MVTHDERYTKLAERTIHLLDGRIVNEASEVNVQTEIMYWKKAIFR